MLDSFILHEIVIEKRQRAEKLAAAAKHLRTAAELVESKMANEILQMADGLERRATNLLWYYREK